MAETIRESLLWIIETVEPNADGVRLVQDELEIDHAEIHSAVEVVAALAETPYAAFADKCGDLQFAFEWGARWQRERERG